MIAGHRDTFFRPLRNVRLGDDVFVDGPQGRVHYRIASLRVVNPRDMSVLEPAGGAVLTLITCYPFWLLGNAPDRFVVRATRVDPSDAAVAAHASVPDPPVPAPAISQPAASVPTTRDARTLGDDDLIRQAVERFRLTYNARLISHDDMRGGGPLRFQACELGIADDRAAAACTVPSRPESAGDREPRVWSFDLRRAEGGWAIQGIEIP